MTASKMKKELIKLGNKFRGSKYVSKQDYKSIAKELIYINNSILIPMFFRNKKEKQ